MQDLGPASDSPAMAILMLGRTGLIDFKFIASCQDLLYLDLSSNSYRNQPITYLEDAEILQYLSLSINMYAKIPSIPNRLLCELDLSFNEIAYVDITTWLPNLRRLNLSGNFITTIKPLLLCPNLEQLLLSDNQIEDLHNLASIAACNNLKDLDLSKNPISDNKLMYVLARLYLPKLEVWA